MLHAVFPKPYQHFICPGLVLWDYTVIDVAEYFSLDSKSFHKFPHLELKPGEETEGDYKCCITQVIITFVMSDCGMEEAH